jgi:hypothetical protein
MAVTANMDTGDNARDDYDRPYLLDAFGLSCVITNYDGSTVHLGGVAVDDPIVTRDDARAYASTAGGLNANAQYITVFVTQFYSDHDPNGPDNFYNYENLCTFIFMVGNGNITN